jgi:hypothetical protein
MLENNEGGYCPYCRTFKNVLDIIEGRLDEAKEAQAKLENEVQSRRPTPLTDDDMTVDPETLACAKIVQALNVLPPESQNRVIRYVLQRTGLDRNG